MYSTVTFEGNLAADVEVKENKAGGVYVDAVVLVNQGKEADGTGRRHSDGGGQTDGDGTHAGNELRIGDSFLRCRWSLTDFAGASSPRIGCIFLRLPARVQRCHT